MSCQGSTRDRKPKYVISGASLEAAYSRLCKRLQLYHSSHAGLQFTPKYTEHFKNLFLRGKGTFTASSMQLLMLALPFALLGPEIAVHCTPPQGARSLGN